MQEIRWKVNTMKPSADENLGIMSVAEGRKARAFHESFPQYEVTPLTHLPHMAENLGLKDLYIKDESYRFGLNAFKVLGGSYSMAKFVAQRLGIDVSELNYDKFVSPELREQFGQATFFTATDGNHGRGVAWAAARLGQKAIIFMPKGTTQTRLENIQKEGAQVTIEDLNYDDCVRKAVAEAAKVPNGVVVQDTAWDGYEDIPSWIMQGYGTMASEAGDQLADAGVMPTHIVVQAGVGSLAGAVVGYFTNLYKDAPQKPKLIVVEAQAADCLYQGALANDGAPRKVGGDLPTIMAGINQALMLSLSMVVIASMIAVGGLGQMVLRGIGRLDMGLATVGGLGIVLLAIVLDRITQAMGEPKRGSARWWATGPAGLAVRLLGNKRSAPAPKPGSEATNSVVNAHVGMRFSL